MYKSNHQIPTNLHSCCCCRSSRGHGTKNFESSPFESGGTEEDYQSIFNCHPLTTSNNQPFAHEDLYENLMELIDDQMMSTMSCLRKKARKILKSELENLSSELTSRPCSCPEETRCRGANITERANEIDYQPQSNFLQKMVQNYRDRKNDCDDEKDLPPKARKKSGKSKQKQKSPKTKTLQSREISPNTRDSYPQKKQKQTVKKSEHISRSKTQTTTRGKRKVVSGEKSDSGLEVTSKTHENSCERCWRFASPPRSPVNKPDQRYDPNFRRGHSCEHLGKPEELINERGNHISPCKNLQPIDTTARANMLLPAQFAVPKKSAQSDIHPTQNYAAQYTPFTGREGISAGGGTPSKAYTKVKQLAFDWPMRKSPTTPSQIEQMLHQGRPHTCEKSKSRLTESTDIGTRLSSGRNRARRPKTYSPGVNREDSWGHYANILDTTEYKDICGAKLQAALDPCINRSQTAKGVASSQGAPTEMRGDGSKGKVLGSGTGLSTARSSRDGFDRSRSAARDVREVREDTRTSREDEDSAVNREGRLGREGRTPKEKGVTDAKKAPPKRKGGDKKTADKKGIGDGRNGADSDAYDRDAGVVDFTGEAVIRTGQHKSEPRKLDGGESSGQKSGSVATARSGQDKSGTSSQQKSKSFNIPKAYLKPKPPPVAKSPKNKSPPKTPKESPRRTKDKKGGESARGEKNQPPSQFEVTSYFKLPEKGARQNYDSIYDGPGITSNLDPCGTLHPIRECQCYPRIAPDNGKDICLCCHCNYEVSEPRRGCFDRPNGLGVGGRCSPPSPPSPPEPQITQTSRLCSPCRGPVFPNISEYPEQLYNRRGLAGSCTEKTIACPYKRFTNVCEENPPVTNSPRHQTGNENLPFRNCSQTPAMNGGMTFPSHFPRKYCVYYMTKGKENKGDDVEVLIEELCQSCPRDERMVDVCEKMKRVTKCQNESMALKFQKGVSECSRPPEKTRVLYF